MVKGPKLQVELKPKKPKKKKKKKTGTRVKLLPLLLLLRYFTAKRQLATKCYGFVYFLSKIESEFEMLMIFIRVKRFGNEFDVEENKETTNI